MQEIGYTGDGKAEKANKIQWGNLEFSDSKKLKVPGGGKGLEPSSRGCLAGEGTPHRGDLASGRDTA